MNQQVYLEITFRHGRPFAGYLHLPRQERDRVVHSRRAEGGLVVDYTEDGRAIGVEITAPTAFDPDTLQALLSELQVEPVGEEDLAPLLRS